MKQMVLTMWYAGILTKGVAAYRLVSNGMAGRYYMLCLFLAACGLRGVTLAAFQGDIEQYTFVWAASAPFMLLIECCAIVQVFWVLTERYPSFQLPGTAFLLSLAMIGAGCSWLFSSTGVPPVWEGITETAQLVERHITLLIAVVLVGARFLLPKSRYLPVRESARCAADLLALDVGVALFASAFTVATHARYPVANSAIPVAGGLLTAILFAVLLPRDRDYCAPAVPVPEGNLDHAERIQLRLVRDIQSLRRALWKG